MLGQGVLSLTLHAAETHALGVILVYAPEYVGLNMPMLPGMIAICCMLMKDHRLYNSACWCLCTG